MSNKEQVKKSKNSGLSLSEEEIKEHHKVFEDIESSIEYCKKKSTK